MDTRYITHRDCSAANKQDTIAVGTDTCSDFMLTFPLELIHTILEYVNLADLFHMELVCKNWKRRVSDDSVWERYTRPLQHKSCQKKPGQRKKQIFTNMCNRIANPEKHSLVKKVDTGERHVFQYDYREGKLAILSGIPHIDESELELFGICIEPSELYLEIYTVGEQIEKVFECEVDERDSFLQLVGSMVFVYSYTYSDQECLYRPVLIYCAISGGLIADVDSLPVADVLEYDEEHDILVVASSQRVAVYPKFKEKLRKDSLGQDALNISSYPSVSVWERIPNLVKIVHPEMLRRQTENHDREFYHVVVVTNSSLLVAVVDSQDHRVLKMNDVSVDAFGRYRGASFLSSSSECKLRIMLLESCYNLLMVNHRALIGQINLPKAGTPIDQMKLNAESLLEGGRFFQSIYEPYFDVDCYRGESNRCGSVLDVILTCGDHASSTSVIPRYADIYVSQDKSYDKFIDQLLDHMSPTEIAFTGRKGLIKIQHPEDARNVKLPRTSWLDRFKTENETSVFLMYTCDGQLHLHMWK